MNNIEEIFRKYKTAVTHLTEARIRVQSLEREVEELERLIRQPSTGPGEQSAYSVPLEPRFQRLVDCFEELGGRAGLRDLVPKTGLSTSGTLAQIRTLQAKGLVNQVERGIYELVSRNV